MEPITIRESYDGGLIEVGVFDRAARPFAHPSAEGHVVLNVDESRMATARLHLTRTEAIHLIVALHTSVLELGPDVVDQPADYTGHTPTDTRPSAPPVADGRGAGLSGLDPAEPGRRINPIGPSPCDTCGSQDHTERFHETAPTLASTLQAARAELLANSTPVTPDLLATPDTTADKLAQLDADIDAEEEARRTTAMGLGLDYAGHAPADTRSSASPVLAAALAAGRARASRSANNPNVCEHGYRFENALCPIAECGASAATDTPVHVHSEGREDCTHDFPQCCSSCCEPPYAELREQKLDELKHEVDQ